MGLTNATDGSELFFSAAIKSLMSCRWLRPGAPSPYLAKKLNGWWWYWNSASGLPALASLQPPEYQAQVTFLSESSSPIVVMVCGGTRMAGSEALAAYGLLMGCDVFTA